MDRAALADFLRRHRERLRPVDVGLPESGGHRRTPGLRREEVARLADISANYYERLEQARGPRPSTQVLASVGRALCLGVEERRYLARLAGQEVAGGAVDDRVPAGVLRLLRGWAESPAYVLNPKYDVLAWNDLASAVFGGLEGLEPARRNLLRMAFGGPGERTGVACGSPNASGLFVRQAVAELRQAAVRYPADPEIPDLIDWLRRCDEAFQDGWDAHELRAESTLVKRFDHPVVGVLELNAQTLHVPDHDLRVVIYGAEPGSPGERALRRLRAAEPSQPIA